ncbi:MAG: hypothetical protein V4591_03475 [Bdellovibrionota bacterium]
MIFFLRAKCIVLLFIITQNCFASVDDPSNTKTGDKPQVPLVNGISARLIPEQSQTITFPETYFSFGIYREFLTNGTEYNASGFGVMLGFDQHIRGMWSGGVEMRWSDWKSFGNSGFANTSPLSLFSKVAATPDLRGFIKNETIAKMFRPYATGGFGYTIFFDQRALNSARSKTAFGQFSATYGGGVKIILPTSFSIKVGAEQWRGIQTSDYFANIVFLELSFGDVDKF